MDVTSIPLLFIFVLILAAAACEGFVNLVQLAQLKWRKWRRS